MDHDLEKPQGETVQGATWAISGLALLLFVAGTLILNRVDPIWFGLATALVVLALAARWALRLGPALASATLVIGLFALFEVALYLAPGNLVAPWGALIVLIGCAVLGWLWGAATAIGVSVAIFRASQTGGVDLSEELAYGAIFLSCATPFIAWMITWPTRIALGWAESSYRQSATLIEEARMRQAELARLSKSLSESYYTLEQLNLELDLARRVAEEARHTKAQFAAAISHELRTPLNLIIGFCEMMVLPMATTYTKPLPTEYREDLEVVYRNAYHISTLVDDILDLGQIDADRMALHRDWTSLKEVVTEAVTSVATLFRNRGLYLELRLSEDLPPVYLDRTRIRQVLINLLSNAARLTDVGGATICAWREGESIVLSIADTGPGIPTEDLPYTFEEFHQAGDPSRRRGGSGLGLAVSKHFTELHQGEIWLESTVGKGTIFFLRLPIAPPALGAIRSGTNWHQRLANRVRGKAERRVLVVDDDPEIVQIFQRYLDGYEVVTLADLYPAGQARGLPFSAVIANSDGAREHWRELAQRHVRWQRIPVVSGSWRTNRLLALNLGTADYLVKPISRERLQFALHQLNRNVQTILIVDDDVDTRRLLSRMLRSLDRRWTVTTAKDGEQALTSIQAHPPDVVLLDLLMPVQDGYSVLTALRADPLLREIPVLIITARGSENQSMVAERVVLESQGGLSVAEFMRWLNGGLTSLRKSNQSDEAPEAAPLVGPA